MTKNPNPNTNTFLPPHRRRAVDVSNIQPQGSTMGYAGRARAVQAWDDKRTGEDEYKKLLWQLQRQQLELRRLFESDPWLHMLPEGAELQAASRVTLPTARKEVEVWLAEGEALMLRAKAAAQAAQQRYDLWRAAEGQAREVDRRRARISDDRERTVDYWQHRLVDQRKIGKRESRARTMATINRAPNPRAKRRNVPSAAGSPERDKRCADLATKQDLLHAGRLRPLRMKRERDGHLRDVRRTWRRYKRGLDRE